MAEYAGEFIENRTDAKQTGRKVRLFLFVTVKALNSYNHFMILRWIA